MAIVLKPAHVFSPSVPHREAAVFIIFLTWFYRINLKYISSAVRRIWYFIVHPRYCDLHNEFLQTLSPIRTNWNLTKLVFFFFFVFFVPLSSGIMWLQTTHVEWNLNLMVNMTISSKLESEPEGNRSGFLGLLCWIRLLFHWTVCVCRSGGLLERSLFYCLGCTPGWCWC